MTTKLCLLTFLLLAPAGARADIDLPRESPPARVSQQIGLTEITVDYASPAVKGRRIWGQVVPYDRAWTISPGQLTTIHFSRDVTVGDRPVAAGVYRLSAIPSKESWTIVLADSKGAEVRFKARPAKASPHRERLLFLFSNFSEDRAELDLEWGDVRVPIVIATKTAEQVAASISELDDAWRSYASAARFMLENKKDFDTGLRYANQSLALKDDWYTRWIKAALLAAKHDYKGAVVEGERAYQLGKELGDGFVLEADLRRNLDDWKKR